MVQPPSLNAASRDEALDIMNTLVMPDSKRFGEVAADFQHRDAAAVLDLDGPPMSFILRSRGGSKTQDAAAWSVGACMAQLAPGSRIYLAAGDKDQARLCLDSVAGFVHRTPMLRDRFEIGSWRAVDLRTGTVIEVLPADQATSWGLRSELTVVDEVCMWPDVPSSRSLLTSLTSATAKSDTARFAAISTPSDPAHFSYKLFEHAREDAMWNLLVHKGKPPWMSEARFEEQRRRLPDPEFRRLFMCEWAAALDRLNTVDQIRACINHSGDLEPRFGEKYVVGVDLGVVHDSTAIVIAHLRREPGGDKRRVVVVDAVKVFAPEAKRAVEVKLREVRDFLIATARRYNRARIIYDPSQARLMNEDLRASGLQTTQWDFHPKSNSKIALSLHSAIANGLVELPDNDELVDELSHVRLRESNPNVYRLDHDPDRHDDMAVALAMVTHDLIGDRSFVPTPPGTAQRLSALNDGLRRPSPNSIDDLYSYDAGEGPDILRVDWCAP